MAQSVRLGATRGVGSETALSYQSVGVQSSDEMSSFGSFVRLLKTTHEFARHAKPDCLEGVAEPYASILRLSETLGLAVATDGVGTKIVVAEELRKYDTVGIDCVAMNANDIICVGAEPVAMVDYIAVRSTDSDQLYELGKGLVEGARQAHISIPGGETAQVGEMLADTDDAFDLVGTCVGTVELDKMILGKSIQLGDALVGFASTGIHSNGVTLARRALERAGLGLGDYVPEFGRTLGDELLEPTAIYVDLALALRGNLSIRAFAHITSDGFINLNRVPDDVAAQAGFLITDLPSAPPIFSVVQELGRIGNEEMFRVFNMGVGFCAVVPEAEAGRAIDIGAACGIKGMRLGTVTDDHPGKVTIRAGDVHLQSCGKTFQPLF